MRWFARRLAFYVFALWVALTINFLLPRLMPGDPIGGILQHLSPSQISANPGIIKAYQTLLGGGNQSIWQDYLTPYPPHGMKGRLATRVFRDLGALPPPGGAS